MPHFVEGISLFYKNKREKLDCGLSYYTDSFQMTVVETAGKMPFFHEAGYQEIGIIMWTKNE